MAAVDPLFREHDGDIGPRYTTDVTVIVDGSAHFVLDQVERFSLCAHLFARDRHTPAALRGALDQAIIVALPGGADDHDVIRAVVRRHAHAPDIVLKASTGDLGCDDRHGLRIDIAKIVRGWKRHAVLEGRAAIVVRKRSHREVGRWLTPSPATAAGMIVLEIF